MCKPLQLSPTAEQRLADCPFIKRDVMILGVCEQYGIVRVKDLLRERFVLSSMFNPEQIAVVHAFLIDLKYSLEVLGLKKLKA